MKLIGVLSLLTFLVISRSAAGNDSGACWRADASLAFGILQEQVKNSDGESGGRLFQSVNVALLLSGSYRALDWLDLGVFVMGEIGERSAADFGGINTSGVPIPISRDGGRYTMFWLGPMVRPHWRNLFVEIAYIAIGIRDDTAYPTLVSPGGSRNDQFKTDPVKAWMIAPGMSTPLSDKIDLTLKVEYRFLYYNRRGEKLAGELLYGTQAIRPHIGIAVSF